MINKTALPLSVTRLLANMTFPIHNIDGPNRSAQPRKTESAAPPAEAKPAETDAGDRVELSTHALRLVTDGDVARVRQARIDRIRQELKNGAYESDHKLGATVDQIYGEIVEVDIQA